MQQPEVLNSIYLLHSFHDICGHSIYFRSLFPSPCQLASVWVMQLTLMGLEEKDMDDRQCSCISLFSNEDMAKN